MRSKAMRQFRRNAIGNAEDISHFVTELNKDMEEKFKKVENKNKENWEVKPPF